MLIHLVQKNALTYLFFVWFIENRINRVLDIEKILKSWGGSSILIGQLGDFFVF